ncbi:MAG: Phage late control protein [Symbiobacteriaceae bacterium]|jgi:hypothetical protein|nr:Phage late control protein [Symbiobacteriaceae bacterium]
MSGTPYIKLTVEGIDITNRLLAVELDEDEWRADAFAFSLHDTDPIYIDAIHEGMSVEVEMGHPDDHPIVFRGLIWRIEAEFRRGRGPVVTFHAMDAISRLGSAPKTQRHWGLPIAVVVAKLAAACGALPGEIRVPGDTAAPLDLPVQQSGETDQAFLFRMAERYGCRAFVEHAGPVDKLHFLPVADLVARQPLNLDITFPSTINRFAPSFDATHTEKGRRLITADRSTGEALDALEGKPRNDPAAQWLPHPDTLDHVGEEDRPIVSQLLAKGAAHMLNPMQRWPEPRDVKGAASRLSGDAPPVYVDQSRWQGMLAWAEGPGCHLMRPRFNIIVEGVGGRFSGPWYMTRVIHQMDVRERDYTIRFACRR